MWRECFLAALLIPIAASAQSSNNVVLPAVDPRGPTEYYRHVFFDNSLTPGSYFYSSGRASEPSTLRLEQDRIPVDHDIFHTPPNSLRLEWTSVSNGGWAATVQLLDFRNRLPGFTGDTFVFWCYSPTEIPAPALPRLQLTDTSGEFSTQIKLGDFVSGIPRQKWTRVQIPLARFNTASLHRLEPKRLKSITFAQNQGDSNQHTLYIDDITIEDSRSKASAGLPPQPQGLRAKGYERHVDLSWRPAPWDNIRYYLIERAAEDGTFKPVGIQLPGIHRFTHWLGAPNSKANYRVLAVSRDGRRSPASESVTATTRPMSNDELMAMVQEACFRYYWEAADPHSGAALENLPGDDRIVATGATGFGVMAIVVGAERGFITRTQAAERLVLLTRFLERAPRYHGVWSHFMNGRTGESLPVFDKFDNAGDLVETAFLIQGLLAARQYFNAQTPAEKELRATITRLWESVEWDWYRRNPQSDALYWHWAPQWAWHLNHRLTGFNETMIVYLLAIASPTHAVPADLYYRGWSGSLPEQIKYRTGWSGTTDGDHYANGNVYDGIKLDVGSGRGGPLFFAHYSYMGFDPRVRDKFTNYFENFRAMALINRAWSIRNPGKFKGYGPNAWGLTASDGPTGYNAHEPNTTTDDGTLTPTGALASFPYTPEESMAALLHYYRERGDLIWGIYGPLDAINETHNWIAPIYMGLNQAPITVMIENHRTGLIWKLFMANPEIQPMLDKIGMRREVPRAQ